MVLVIAAAIRDRGERAFGDGCELRKREAPVRGGADKQPYMTKPGVPRMLLALFFLADPMFIESAWPAPSSLRAFSALVS